jgi:hypothetical protein
MPICRYQEAVAGVWNRLEMTPCGQTGDAGACKLFHDGLTWDADDNNAPLNSCPSVTRAASCRTTLSQLSAVV